MQTPLNIQKALTWLRGLCVRPSEIDVLEAEIALLDKQNAELAKVVEANTIKLAAIRAECVPLANREFIYNERYAEEVQQYNTQAIDSF